MAISERLKQRIKALRGVYVASFPAEASALAEEQAAMLAGGETSAISSRAHRLAGTAGSYQLHTVCACAQQVERLCEGGAPVAEITVAVDALRQELLRGDYE